jgi:N-acetylmuramic acid 6-phosphate etherase
MSIGQAVRQDNDLGRHLGKKYLSFQPRTGVLPVLLSSPSSVYSKWYYHARTMLGDLVTEGQNPASEQIDRLTTTEMLTVINREDREVAYAVERELPAITQAVDGIVDRLESGGRLFYVGAGTSGRLGVLDASECAPTFNTPADLVQGLIAGGDRALRWAVESAEDNQDQARVDLSERGFSDRDVLVGIAASGRTPYVVGAIGFAKGLGALTIGLSCAPGSDVSVLSDISITPVVGPEVITGSTRMRAGTATKLVLNMLSTGALVRLGYVYGNLMVNVQPTNEKLEDRARRIIASASGASYEEASELLQRGGSVRAAIVMKKLGVDRGEAERRLAGARGKLRVALGED